MPAVLELQITLLQSDKCENGEVTESAFASLNLCRWSSLTKPCELCEESCGSVIDIQSHYLEHHVDHLAEFVCKLCNSRFSVIAEFANHSAFEHEDHLKHCCLICDKLFVNLRHVSDHLLNDHPSIDIFQCTTCGLYFGTEDELHEHSSLHSFPDKTCSKRKLEESESAPDETATSDDQQKPRFKRCKKELSRSSRKRPARSSHGMRSAFDLNSFEKLFADELSGASDLCTNLHVNTCESNQLASGEIPDEIANKIGGLSWKDILSCGICKLSFPSSTELLHHGDTQHHTRSKLFHCQECDGEFTANCESPLINHLVERHHCEHLKFCCLICSKMFFNLQSLIVHNKTHDGSTDLLVCLICGWYAKTFDDLKEHKMLHLTLEKSENQLLCEQVFEKFSKGLEPTARNHGVAEHEKIADGTVTQECQERFSIDWSFGRYHCDPCDATYATPFELFVHQRLKHPKEAFKKNFFCTLCTDKKDYSNLFTFVNHATSKHFDHVKFTCIICSKAFWNYLSLANHYKDVHSSFPCILCCHCGKLFINATVASSHFKSLNLMLTPEQRKLVKEGKLETESSSHICHVCARCFKSRGTLLNHLKTHEILEPSDLLQCHICSKL